MKENNLVNYFIEMKVFLINKSFTFLKFVLMPFSASVGAITKTFYGFC